MHDAQIASKTSSQTLTPRNKGSDWILVDPDLEDLCPVKLTPEFFIGCICRCCNGIQLKLF